jgi:hypothetical protein
MTDGNFWTSGNDDKGPLFMWDSTGQTMGSYSNWAYSQPDNGAIDLSPQNCMLLNSTDNFKWYDYGCKSEEIRYICEKKSKVSHCV